MLGFSSVFATAGGALLQVAGPGFVLLALGLVALGSGTFLSVVVPFYGSVGASVPATALFCGAVFITYGIAYNFLKAVLTPPGSPPRAGDSATISPSQHRECRKCGRMKVPRAHHCSVCGRCVLRMDHHCVWIANCVGAHNHRHFVLFMLYTLAGCLFWAAFASPLLLRLGDSADLRAAVPVATLVFTGVMLLSLFLALGLMFSWQVVLALTNQTTIEWHDNRYYAAAARARGLPPFRNPYDLGSPMRNLCEFLGVAPTAASPGRILLALLPHAPVELPSYSSFEGEEYPV